MLLINGENFSTRMVLSLLCVPFRPRPACLFVSLRRTAFKQFPSCCRMSKLSKQDGKSRWRWRNSETDTNLRSTETNNRSYCFSWLWSFQSKTMISEHWASCYQWPWISTSGVARSLAILVFYWCGKFPFVFLFHVLFFAPCFSFLIESH